MPITAQEQLMLELVNRARLDPAGEAARYGIALNDSLAPGTITTAVKQVLASNDLLQNAASNHSIWMLNTDIFNHTGINGSSPGDRMASAGYVFGGGWGWGENIAWTGSTGSIDLSAAIANQHRDLFLSSGHRENILAPNYREIGVAQERGVFSYGGTGYNTSMVTQTYAYSGSSVFLTGVAYADRDGDRFYSIGEGAAGVRFAIGAAAASSEAAGGYALKTAAAAGVSVAVTQGTALSTVLVDLSAGNVKLDLVNGNSFFTSGNLTLVTGVSAATLLGAGALTLTGNAAANTLTGNKGANVLIGNDGADTLNGGLGNDRLDGGNYGDRLIGGDGNDTVLGGNGADTAHLQQGNDVYLDTAQIGAPGRDTVFGGLGNDTINGGGGDDRLFGDDGNDSLVGGVGNDALLGGNGADQLLGQQGNDVLIGNAGADRFVFGPGLGLDRVADFIDNADTLFFSRAIWGGAAMTAQALVSTYAQVVNGNTVIDFGGGNSVTLTGVTSLAALYDDITIL